MYSITAEVTNEMLNVCKEARSHKLGAFSPKFNINNILLQGFEKHLPENAHLLVNGKVHISLTRVYDGKNVIVSHFNRYVAIGGSLDSPTNTNPDLFL